ncbi:MAG: hypothetical protein KDK71_05175 [Chlamydiia bacterium]|nr:hypothetical protein [Chlamydiia bacterium]
MKAEDLVGEWKISRTVRSPDGKAQGSMQGVGHFRPLEKNQLLYEEELWHQTEQKAHYRARKWYRYEFLTDRVLIYFHNEEKGRLFLTIPLREMRGEAMCNQDQYILTWEWRSKSCYLTRYLIRGPKKNTLIESECIR